MTKRMKNTEAEIESEVLPAPEPEETVIEAPTQPDIFKPLGFTTVYGVTTMSFAAEVDGEVILKTVTAKNGIQSECLLPMFGMRIVPAATEGFYKVVGK